MDQMRAHSAPAARAAASASAIAVESIDDIVLRILSHLSVADRLGLASVSRRWSLLARSFTELRFVSGQEAHVVRTCARAGDSLVRLDLASVGAEAGLEESLLAALKHEDFGQYLRQLVLWDDTQPETAVRSGVRTGLTLSLDVAGALCEARELDEGTRLRVRGMSQKLSRADLELGSAPDFAQNPHPLSQVNCKVRAELPQLLALLDAAPGKHAAAISVEFSTSDEDAATLRSILLHPRLAAASIVIASEGHIRHATVSAVLSAFGPQPAAPAASTQPPPPPPLGCLVIDTDWADDEPVFTAANAAALEQAAAAAAAGGGATTSARRLLGLRFESQPDAALLRGVIAAVAGAAAASSDAADGGLRHLSMEVAQLSCAAAAVSALPLAGAVSLELCSLQLAAGLGGAVEEATAAAAQQQLLSDLSQLLARPECRLRSLTLDGNGPVLGDEAAAVGGLLGSFAAALQANTSLQMLSLRGAVTHPPAAAFMWGSLARRGAPLEILRASDCCFSDVGACSGGAVFTCVLPHDPRVSSAGLPQPHRSPFVC